MDGDPKTPGAAPTADINSDPRAYGEQLATNAMTKSSVYVQVAEGFAKKLDDAAFGKIDHTARQIGNVLLGADNTERLAEAFQQVAADKRIADATPKPDTPVSRFVNWIEARANAQPSFHTPDWTTPDGFRETMLNNVQVSGLTGPAVDTYVAALQKPGATPADLVRGTNQFLSTMKSAEPFAADTPDPVKFAADTPDPVKSSQAVDAAFFATVIMPGMQDMTQTFAKIYNVPATDQQASAKPAPAPAPGRKPG